jgi:sugar lactone lactonase YvrE
VKLGHTFALVLCFALISAAASAPMLLPFSGEWRYNESGTNLGTIWQQPGYDDSSWPTGRAALAFEDNPAVTPYTNTVLSLTNADGHGIITYYFRTHFAYAENPDPIWLGLSTLIDDGAVVYLNGLEIYRLNMPPGAPAFTTLASNAVNDAEFKGVDFLATNLVQGDNVIAVEVHQTSTNSSDIVFGLQLAVVKPPVIAAQPVSLTVARTYNATFSVGMSNDTLMAYQWRKNDVDISGATSSSYIITNVQNQHAGAYSVVVSNLYQEVTSSNAILSVTAPYTFITMAGTPRTSGTNDGLGAAARFDSPRGVAVDTNGNVYVSDFRNHTIRKVTPEGFVTTLAGVPEIAGWRDGPGNEALFTTPRRAAADRLGNLFVADHGNHVIRKISPDGFVTTIAGAPQQSGRADGTNDTARFNDPSDVAIDRGGNVFVGDTGNRTVRRIQPLGTNWIVTTIAGRAGQAGTADGTNGNARFRDAIGLDVDRDGNVYVADNGAHTIRKIVPIGTNWVVSTLAGLADNPGDADGRGEAARFRAPIGIAVDAAGIVFVGDTGNATVRKISPDGEVVTLAGLAGVTGGANGTGSAARFDESRSVAVDKNGNLYVCDADLPASPSNNTIRKGWIEGTVPMITVGRVDKNETFIEMPCLITSGAISNLTMIYAAQLRGPWVPHPSATLVTNVPDLFYRFTVPITGSPRFFRVRSP